MAKFFILTVTMLLIGSVLARSKKSVKSRKAHRRSSAPCHSLCGMGGDCMLDGRCLCWNGWTGPNSSYIDEHGKKYNRIVADYCTTKCEYITKNRNPTCLFPAEKVSTTTLPPTKPQEKMPDLSTYPTVIATSQLSSTLLPPVSTTTSTKDISMSAEPVIMTTDSTPSLNGSTASLENETTAPPQTTTVGPCTTPTPQTTLSGLKHASTAPDVSTTNSPCTPSVSQTNTSEPNNVKNTPDVSTTNSPCTPSVPQTNTSKLKNATTAPDAPCTTPAPQTNSTTPVVSTTILPCTPALYLAKEKQEKPEKKHLRRRHPKELKKFLKKQHTRFHRHKNNSKQKKQKGL